MEGRFRIGGIDAIRNACLVIIKNGILEVDIVAQCDLVLGNIADNPIEGIGCKLLSLGCTGLRRGEVISAENSVVNSDTISLSNIMVHHNSYCLSFISGKIDSAGIHDIIVIRS